ncbi:MAG: LysM peptidoglycan-binding domain-containing protein [candidate division WOR-3 bacterium]|nr:MAG: LysM peptidoglycan-binding domain-containing protein [candidate division WOR-3 bacterium]
MKKVLSITLILCFVVPVLAFAQEKMTEEEAQAELARITAELEQINADIAALEAEVAELTSSTSTMEAEYSSMQEKAAELRETWKRCQYGRYTVVEGDWLSKIASMQNVYRDGSKWPWIHEANTDKIKDPNLIYPGWVLLIPTFDQYTVGSGDCLWLIASYLSIYSDAKRWPEIYEANKDKIKDPDLIYPKQEFVIPRD